MGWKKGPLPKDTWHWGGCVKACPSCKGAGKGEGGGQCPDCLGTGSASFNGFYFADFQGDKVVIEDGKRTVLAPEEVLWYDNCLTLPPGGGANDA